MDRASTIRFYDHYGHVSAAVCYQNTLHARTGDGRLDHARTHEPRDRKGVKWTLAAVLTPFPPLIPSEGSSAFHADARLRARAVGREPVDPSRSSPRRLYLLELCNVGR